MNKQSLIPSYVTICAAAALSFSQPLKISLTPDSINTTFIDTTKNIDTLKVDITAENKASVRTSAIDSSSSKSISTKKQTDLESNPFELHQTFKQSFKTAIISAAIADIDKDSQNETILLTQGKLFVYRYKNKVFPQIYEYKAPAGVSFVSVDVADLNKNGLPEMYLSATNIGADTYWSMTIEYNKGQFTVLQNKIPYLLRILTLADGTKTLIGQKYSNDGTHKGDIFYIDCSGKNCVNKVEIGVSNKPVHSFSLLNNTNDSSSFYACINSSGHIEIIHNRTLNTLSASEEKYGGNPYYISLPSMDASVSNTSQLPIRILSIDFNNDGLDELVCVKNNEAFNNMLESTKLYTRSHFEILSFEGNSMLRSVWKSGSFNGFISDIACGDFDNDGDKELLIAKPIRPENSVLKKAETEIIVLEK